ncbi:hypothetical protein MRB53_023394 [Persea americana]|uniref:Uncharacterized protein n=1 Tax=Persea americana TaxID=3435 RepID=A0ACC2L999_PERAE|nr:hypothetical protein MRB53_023394 [Persea americana]
MKQFGLQQIVSPPFYGAFNREDRVLKATVEYSKKMKEEIKEWNGRKKSVLKGEVEVDSNSHSDECSQWIMRFKSACASRFLEFKMQDYISSSSDKEERKRPKTSDDSISQLTPSNVPLQMPPHPIPPSPIHVDSISSQPVEDIISSPSGFLTPPRPVLAQEFVVELSPGESLPSKIIRIKARHRKNKLPVRFEPYQVTTYGARSAENSLTVEEAALLEIFWNEYEAK